VQRSSGRAFGYVIGALWVLPAVLLVLGSILLPDTNAGGQCSGLGFGCTLTPRDSVAFLAFFATPVLLVCGVVALVLLAVLRARNAGFRAAAPSLQAFAVVGLVVVCAVLLLVLGWS
jgi:uncharacterized membrane protein YhaH (DUF805 family)